MPTNLHIDDELLAEAQRLGGKSTKRATVDEALKEYVARRRRLETLSLFGTVEVDPAYSPRRERGRG